MDVKSAFLYGRARRPIFIDVPQEDPRSQEEGMLVKLIESSYVTRDAHKIWEDCLLNEMKLLRFVESLSFPCLFHHGFMNVEFTFHVDDVCGVGPLENVKKVYHGLAESFEVKCMYAGSGTRTNEVECLGRGVMFTAGGVEIHGGPKHAAMVLTELEMPMCKPMGGLHVVDGKALDALADETRDFMPPSEARRHRSAVVRVVFMAQDRLDLDVAACIVSKT